MILSELVNNAARHAFSAGEGEIRAELLSADPFVECRVMDNGSAIGEVHSGHGLKIIDALSKSLGGQFEQKFGSKGSRATLVFSATGPCSVAKDQARTQLDAHLARDILRADEHPCQTSC
jgi:two-component sensor histidine kinase